MAHHSLSETSAGFELNKVKGSPPKRRCRPRLKTQPTSTSFRLFSRPPLWGHRGGKRSAGARDRFPRVLYLAGKFAGARKAFAAGAAAVPEWAFLRWVDQMLGVAGRQEGPVVIQASA